MTISREYKEIDDLRQPVRKIIMKMAEEYENGRLRNLGPSEYYALFNNFLADASNTFRSQYRNRIHQKALRLAQILFVIKHLHPDTWNACADILDQDILIENLEEEIGKIEDSSLSEVGELVLKDFNFDLLYDPDENSVEEKDSDKLQRM